MEYVINGRQPAVLFRYFEEISAIPRASYHEEAIADYLVRFAEERGLYCYRDELHNVLIKKPATEGQQGREPILFQGHTDMVCEKNAGVEHDFSTEGIKLWVDGNFLRAKGTTLGADNGVAVALMLAILDGAIESHPAVECLFTTAEEVGLNGAHGFDYSKLEARRMVNADSEALGTITCGCAGGVRSELKLPMEVEPFSGNALRISVGGLMGGHSGENINCGRANANKLMGRLLASVRAICDARLISVNGGSKDNAIPRECVALISVPDAEAATAAIEDEAAKIARELVREDGGFSVTVEDADTEAVMLTRGCTAKAVAVLVASANGVFEMSRNVKGLVEFSRNLGVVRTHADTMEFVFAARSAIESRLDASIREIDAISAVVGGTTRHHSRYPGWDFAPASELREAYIKAYRDVTGEEAKVNVIHAGLECGIIFSHLPDMDIISVGPNLHDLHSPDESLELDSVEVFWKTVVRLLQIL
jgi:dipeptidase D